MFEWRCVKCGKFVEMQVVAITIDLRALIQKILVRLPR